MASDDTDKRLIQGTVLMVMLLLVAYFMPYWGFQQQRIVEEEKRLELTQIGPKYARNYGEFHAAYLGENSSQPIANPVGTLMTQQASAYTGASKTVTELITKKEEISRMAFPAWTEIPEDFKTNPGVYFVDTWKRLKEELLVEWRTAGVECLDEDIGFKAFAGNVGDLDERRTREYLRELYIAEKIIRLCIAAKKREEAYEKSKGVVPEAFMRIMEVSPQDSVATGPTALLLNLAYNPAEKNPNSERFKKYVTQSWRNFIQEYPVQIKLQCDVNTYMLFLHSVREPQQFLVIRNLEILSPFLEQSIVDRSELRGFKQETEDPAARRSMMERPEAICIRMSAAGMDFFDPELYPNGLGTPIKKEREQGPRRRNIRQALQGGG